MLYILKNILIIGACLSVLISEVSAQEISGSKDIQIESPIGIPILLSGNFGEPRSSHFHTGIDIKTGGRTGLPVLAALEGSVVRVRVAPGGYGKSLYVQHPGGLMTVYGHLNRFSPEIAAYVIKEQYRVESFAVDLYPEEGTFIVDQGEEIARSGNTGSSQGPHLHFELRNLRSGNPMNPQRTTLDISDNIPPLLERLFIYNQSVRYEPWIPVSRRISGQAGQYQLNQNEVLPVSPLSTFGIQGYDLLDGSHNHCGIYQVSLYVADELIFEYHLDEVAFNEARYIHSFMDYPRFQHDNDPVIHLFVQPNNHSSLYTFTSNRGYVQFLPDSVYHVRIEASDISGNTSTLTFRVQLDPGAFETDPSLYDPDSEYIHYAETQHIEHQDIRIDIPKGSLYDDLYFSFEIKESGHDLLSPVYVLHRDDVGLHQSIKISIDGSGIPDELRSKAVIVRISDDDQISSLGGQWQEDYIYTRSSRFGNYAIACDTLPPRIEPINFTPSSDFRDKSSLRIRIADDLSGVASFRGEIDGQWVLFEYDPKKNLLEYRFDSERLEMNRQHELKIVVLDRRQNRQEYQMNFYK